MTSTRAQGSTHKSTSYKRSGKACISCRSRKVRCDVSRRGQPCTNCSIDHKHCLVVGRVPRLQEQAPRRTKRMSQNVPDPSDSRSPDVSRDDPGVCSTKSAVGPSFTANESSLETILGPFETDNIRNPPEGLGSPSKEVMAPAEASLGRQHTGSRSPPEQSPESNVPMARAKRAENAPNQDEIGIYCNSVAPANNESEHPGVNEEESYYQRRPARKGSVIYSHYSFLTAGNFHKIPTSTAIYLESQGCLHIPSRPMLDEFLQQYFLHVHVAMPMLNEEDFWDMVYHDGSRGGSRHSMSLLVFQAMLFASCSYVSNDVIAELGFPSVRVARAEFYHRAKGLYDSEIEGSQLCLAQAALMLTGWVPPVSKSSLRPYLSWLDLAVQHARALDADRSASATDLPNNASAEQQKSHSMLRRLWWCCILKDRLGALVTRRKLCIPPWDFPSGVSPLLVADLRDEIFRSSVYTARAKRLLERYLVLAVEFCVVLADIVALVFPFADAGKKPGTVDTARIEACRLALQEWRTRAATHFPESDTTTSALGEGKRHTASVIIHIKLLYIYYHSARIALNHYKLLCYSVAAEEPNAGGVPEHPGFEASCRELEDAILRIAECYGDLTRRRLTRSMPITAVPILATPLAVHVIDLSLAQRHSPGSMDVASPNNPDLAHLNVLLGALRAFESRYYGAEFVSETVYYAANLTRTEVTNHRSSLTTWLPVTDWKQLLRKTPRIYLRIVMGVIDECLHKGRILEEGDFPEWIDDQGSQLADFETDKVLTELFPHHATLPSTQSDVHQEALNPTWLDLILPDIPHENMSSLDDEEEILRPRFKSSGDAVLDRQISELGELGGELFVAMDSLPFTSIQSLQELLA